METFLIKALQLIVALAFLVLIHEFGHFIFARIFGIKVEKFYMFFDPYFSLIKWKPKQRPDADPDKTSWRDTEYGIGWLPLGGYCKIAGMIDESMDTEQMKQEPKPWEFRSKEAWKRLLVMLGGVLFNFILAILIYAGIAMHWGSAYIPLEAATEGFDFTETAQKAGFRNGDIPLTADGKKLDAADSDFRYQVANAKVVTVLRNKRDTVTINLPENFIMQLNADKGMFFDYRLPVYIDRIVPGEVADKAELMEGDHIIAVDSIPTPSFSELTEALKKFADEKTTVTIERNGKQVVCPITPNSYGKLGFQVRPLTDVYKTVKIKYNIFQSIPKGWELGTTMLSNYVGSMKHIFSPEGAESIGGFGAIGNMFPSKWNWLSFWEITAFLSVALAFMNILPIPGLDGGHVMFLIWEMITGKPAPEKVLIVAQYIGMAFILLLLVYANGNDLFRAFFK